MASIIFSHHSMASFHNEYNIKTTAKHLRSLTEKENADMKTYLLDHRKPIWDFIQTKIVEIFRATTNFLFNLSVRELFDILALTNKFIEIGIEFVKPKDSILLDEVLSL